MNDLLSALGALGEAHELVRLYPPASIRQIMRSAGHLPGDLDAELVEFLKLTNGASLLDYCFPGCKNPRISDVAGETLDLWAGNHRWARNFVVLVATSTDEFFGYLRLVELPDGTHPVAYLPTSRHEGALVVSSSVGRFFRQFSRDLASALAADSEALHIEHGDWPLDLSHWATSDERLASLYGAGSIDGCWKGDPEIRRLVTQWLR